MQRSGHRSCSFPTCCRVVYITAPRDINITRIYTGSCITKREEQKYTVYYNNNQSSQYLYEDSCCHGDIYVYYDYLTPATTKRILSTARTGIRTASSTPSRTIPSDPTTTFVLVTVLVSLALLIILGVGALLYKCFRKSRSTPVERFTDHCEYLGIEESRITTHNYSVIEMTEESHPHSTRLNSPTTSVPCPSSEYETVQISSEPENLRGGVPYWYCTNYRPRPVIG